MILVSKFQVFLSQSSSSKLFSIVNFRLSVFLAKIVRNFQKKIPQRQKFALEYFGNARIFFSKLEKVFQTKSEFSLKIAKS